MTADNTPMKNDGSPFEIHVDSNFTTGKRQGSGVGMSTECPRGDFNPQAIAEALYGTWTYPFPEDPTGVGLIHFTDTGLYIQFMPEPKRPGHRVQMRLWYSVESPTQLRFRPKPDDTGRLREYRFEGNSVIISASDRSWHCTRPAPEEIPEWFQRLLASALGQT